MQREIIKYILPPKHILLILLIATQVDILNARNFAQDLANDFAGHINELFKSDYSVFDYQELKELVNLDRPHWEPPVSQLCWDHSILYAKNLLNILLSDSWSDEPTKNQSTLWSIQMFDAMAKIPTGILDLNWKWVGSFGECLKIKTTDLEENFQGQYCTILYDLEDKNFTKAILQKYLNKDGMATNREPTPVAALLSVAIEMGICWPSSCNETEVDTMINIRKILTLPVDKRVKPGYCQTDSPATYDTTTIAIISMFSVLGAFVLFATIYDLVQHHRPKYEKLATEILPIPETEYTENADKRIMHKFLVCFSVYTNGNKISIPKEPSDKILEFVHGIRTMSLLWVIISQCLLYAPAILPIKDFIDILFDAEGYLFDFLINATFSLDSILLISGFCVSVSFFKQLEKPGGRVAHLLHYYIYGYLRITPVLAMAIAFIAGPYYLLGSGPGWPSLLLEQEKCRTDWWKTILYINNLFDTYQMCVEVSWYLSLEMQYYIIAPLILYPLYKKPIIGYVIMAMLFAITIITPSLIIYYKDYPGYPGIVDAIFPKLPTAQHYNTYIYIKPWCRMGPYLIGIALAYYLHRKKMRCNMSPIFALLGWVLSIGLNLTLVLSLYHYFNLEKFMSDALSSVYGGLSRPAWGISVAWMVFACTTGYGGFITHFLTWRPLVTMSRYFYSIYLVHVYVVLILFAMFQVLFYFDIYYVALLYFGVVVVTTSIAAIFYLLSEAPVIELEKAFASLETDKNEPRRLSTL